MEEEKATSALLTEEQWEKLIYSIVAEVDRSESGERSNPSPDSGGRKGENPRPPG